MPLTSNNIKVSSGRRLRQQNRNSQQKINKAGSNDVENQPGQVKMHTSVENLTGVSGVHHQPQTITSAVQFGEGLSTRTGGSGKGGVQMPPEQPRPPLTSDQLTYPYSYSQRWRSRNKLVDPPLSDIHRTEVTNNAGSTVDQPGATNFSGAIIKEVERTTGKDSKRLERNRRRRSRRRGK